jgi:hypothetical protein
MKSSVLFVGLVVLIVTLLGGWAAVNPSPGPLDLQIMACAHRALEPCNLDLQNGANVTLGLIVAVDAVVSSTVVRPYFFHDYTMNFTIQQLNGTYQWTDAFPGYAYSSDQNFSLSPGHPIGYGTVWNTSGTYHSGFSRSPPPTQGTYRITTVLYDANGEALAISMMVLELVRPSI